MRQIKLCNFSLIILITILFSCSSEIKLPEKGICAHRGASQYFPENTIPAFEEAIRLGAQMIEFDVRMTVDSVVVIIHDAELDRTTNGSGMVAEKDIAYISSLDAGSWKSPKYKNEKVPLFKDVINILPTNIWLNIHIKGGPESAERAAKIIVNNNREHQSIFACKSKSAEKILNIYEGLLICNMDRLTNSVEYVDDTIKRNSQFIQLKTRSDADLPILVKKLKDNNIKINYYGADSKEKFITLVNNGIDFVLTNNLEELINIGKNIGIKPIVPNFN